jgi:hypothetical protein
VIARHLEWEQALGSVPLKRAMEDIDASKDEVGVVGVVDWFGVCFFTERACKVAARSMRSDQAENKERRTRGPQSQS